MKKTFLLVLILIILTGCTQNKITKEDNKMNNTNLNININNKNYIAKLEDNETVQEFIKLLPLELTMTDLNQNEKYVYLDIKLPTNPYNPDRINKGDIMLYGNNCLVIFYKDFDTTYKYTKIGHIDNLEYFNTNNINVKITTNNP